MKKYFFLLATISFLLIHLVSAQENPFEQVISNSEDWRDVYSIVHYGNLIGVDTQFLVSVRHGPLLMNGLNKQNAIRIISSDRRPQVISYEKDLEARGFKVEREISVDSANEYLIRELEGINNFIVVGSTYGQSAIAVAPYAVKSKSWVFFADSSNIASISSILEDINVENLIIYGPVDREVKDELSAYNPEIIDTGDRFEDNIEIVKKYIKIFPTEQLAFTNGEFIEKGLMSGFDPIMFTGKDNVPEQIQKYLQSSDFSVGVLVGSDLVGAATNIRRSTGISVIVKFAQGARSASGPIAAVEGLDLFYLPTPVMKLTIHSAKYNRASSQIELTYKSDSNVPVYFKGTITPIDENGEGSRFGDTESVFISPGDYKTVIYPGINLIGEDLSLDIFAVYGETPSALEKILETRIQIEQIDSIDDCNIEIRSLIYSKPKDSFIIKIKNLEKATCWVDAELSDMLIDGRRTTLGSEGNIQLKSEKKGLVIIEQEMDDSDLDKNAIVDLTAYYGQRSDSLVNILQGKFPLKIQIISPTTIILIIAIIICLILVLLLFRRRKKKDYW